MPKAKEATQRPPQHQSHQPGSRNKMTPKPEDNAEGYHGSGKLRNKVALITGGDSGIGRSVAIAFAKEGADVVIVYLDEKSDAQEAKQLVEENGSHCELCQGDVKSDDFCRNVIATAIAKMGKLDILVNNAAVQYPQDSIEDITPEQLEETFQTNILSFFHLARHAFPHMGAGSAIINTASITAFRGSPGLLDYSATKGAIVAFTRSLASSLVKKGIRVNAVAPGPVWTPLIPSSFDADEVAEFGSDNPMGRAAKADEISPCYVFLAGSDSAFMTGEVLHPNGGAYFA